MPSKKKAANNTSAAEFRDFIASMDYSQRIKFLSTKYCCHRHLTRQHSQAILDEQCPFCPMFKKCDPYQTDGNANQKFQVCKLRSTEMELVWLDVSNTLRPEVRLGDVYGKLEVEEYGGYDSGGRPMWVCRCECGNTKRVRGYDLIGGAVVSCGCGQGKRNDLTSRRINTSISEEEERTDAPRKRRYVRGSSVDPDGTEHKYPSEFSSRVGQRVDDLVRIRDDDDPYNPDTNKVFFAPRKCGECGGILRYDKNGFRVCVDCSLLDGEFIVLDNEFSTDQSVGRLQKNVIV